jgi:hypothetical protein
MITLHQPASASLAGDKRTGENFCMVAKTSREELYTAYHEAGHAVVAKVNGIRVTGITIIPNRDTFTLGMVNTSNILYHKAIDSTSSTADRWRMERVVQVGLAGIIAEQKHQRDNNLRRRVKGIADGDYERAINTVRHFCGSDAEVEAYLNLLAEQTKTILNDDENWNAVEKLTLVLIEKKKLSAREVSQWFKDNLPV